MNYLSKLNAIAASITTFSMFVGIQHLSPLIAEFTLFGQFGSALAATLLAFGTYRGLSNGLNQIFTRSIAIRKLLLGDAFIEGTWIGSYKNKSKVFYTVETFRFSDGEYRIDGTEFSDDGQVRAHWNSDKVHVDTSRFELHYIYHCDKHEAGGQHSGIGVFQLSKSGPTSSPDRMDGYSIDSLDGQKDPNTEIKISDVCMDPSQSYKKAVSHFSNP